MRIIVRILLALAFFIALIVGVVVLIRLGPSERETWAVLAGVLAVITSLVSAWTSQRVLEIQEDATRPHPVPFFDVSSRYDLMLLRLKNCGAGVAYDINLEWDSLPVNEDGEPVSLTNERNGTFAVLLPQDSVSALVGRPFELFKKHASIRHTGTVRFKDATGKEHHHRFVCSADEFRNQLVHDKEMQRTLYDLQQIPEQLKAIADTLGKKLSR